METMGIYSLKAALILFLFWAIYQLFLRKETFYRFNRFFLLVGLIAAVLLPLMKVHYPVVVEIPVTMESRVPEVEELNVHSQVELTGLGKSDFLTFAYFSGICLIGLFLLIGLGKLGWVIRSKGYRIFPTFYLVESSPYESSFSFFRFIFLPESIKDERDRKIILNHEEAHIVQKHWIDLLISSVFRMLWWFNPVIWLYEKSIRENHEFLADHLVLRRHSQTDYFSALANQWFKRPSFPLTNSFNYSTQLKRIKMMKKNISNPIKKLSVLLLVPALAVFFWAFAEPEYKMVKLQPENADREQALMATEHLLPQVNDMKDEAPQLQKDSVLSEIVVTGYGKQRADDTKDKAPQLQKDTKVSEVVVVGYGKQRTDKQESGEELLEGKLSKITIRKREVNQNGDSTNTYKVNIGSTNPIFVIDGVKSDRTEFSKMDAEDIASISLLKGRVAKEYGEEGENDVMLIVTKKAQKISNPETDKKTSDLINILVSGKKIAVRERHIKGDSKTTIDIGGTGEPLFVIDGVKSDRAEFSKMDAEDIESISILKDGAAKEYGEEGKNGVFFVTTRKATKTE